MKKTYIDECLERANKATEGLWKYDCGNMQVETDDYRIVICNAPGNLERLQDVQHMYANYTPEEYPEIAAQLKCDNHYDHEFIAHARTDVPELARRLKLACEALRRAEAWMHGYSDGMYGKLADKLEAPLEEK